MGSSASCPSNSVPSNIVKLITWNGSIQELQPGIKAAELMLDNPQHFVCHANGLQIGRRINPLSADEELDLGHLYFLLPMTKLQSVFSETDMASLALKANSAMKPTSKRSSGAKVLPVFGDLLMRPLPPEKKMDDHLEDILAQGKEFVVKEFVVPKLKLDDVPELTTAVAQLRLSTFKQWKPMLETIDEFQPTLRDLMHSDIGEFW